MFSYIKIISARTFTICMGRGVPGRPQTGQRNGRGHEDGARGRSIGTAEHGGWPVLRSPSTVSRIPEYTQKLRILMEPLSRDTFQMPDPFRRPLTFEPAPVLIFVLTRLSFRGTQ